MFVGVDLVGKHRFIFLFPVLYPRRAFNSLHTPIPDEKSPERSKAASSRSSVAYAYRRLSHRTVSLSSNIQRDSMSSAPTLGSLHLLQFFPPPPSPIRLHHPFSTFSRFLNDTPFEVAR